MTSVPAYKWLFLLHIGELSFLWNFSARLISEYSFLFYYHLLKTCVELRIICFSFGLQSFFPPHHPCWITFVGHGGHFKETTKHVFGLWGNACSKAHTCTGRIWELNTKKFQLGFEPGPSTDKVRVLTTAPQSMQSQYLNILDQNCINIIFIKRYSLPVEESRALLHLCDANIKTPGSKVNNFWTKLWPTHVQVWGSHDFFSLSIVDWWTTFTFIPQDLQPCFPTTTALLKVPLKSSFHLR